jgi:hypothetical protein
VEVIRDPEWGVHLVNYSKYRAKRDPEERRRQVREAVQRLRERQRDDVIRSKPRNPRKAQAEAEAEAEDKNNGERTESPVGDPATTPADSTPSKLATKDRPKDSEPAVSRDCERFLAAFQLAFGRQRRTAANPKLRSDFAARLREGWTAEQIVAAPFIEAQSLLDRDDKAAREIRAECQPSHLLRDGKHARTTKQGFTAGATHRLAAAYERAPQVELAPRLRRAAQELGVWETLQAAGVTAEGDAP